jgi:hypothetical protein
VGGARSQGDHLLGGGAAYTVHGPRGGLLGGPCGRRSGAAEFDSDIVGVGVGEVAPVNVASR